MTDYYKVNYDNLAGGSFTEGGLDLQWDAGASTGYIVTNIETGTTGKLAIGLITGTPPDNNDVLTQGVVTADTNEPISGAATLLLYPAFFREDVAVAGSGAVTWTGPGLGVTHFIVYNGQTVNFALGDILTFANGETAELIEQNDQGASGTLGVRMISFIDQSIPGDGDSISGSPSGGDGNVNGVVHDRTYTPLHLHRLLMDLNDDEQIAGDDDLSIVDPTASARSTDEIVQLLGTVNVTDTVIQHMYGGSVSQASGATLYSGVDVQVTSPLATTQPVLIQNDAIITDYWSNAYNPDSIAGNVRIMVKTRDDGVDIDGKRIRGALLEFGELYFFAGTTLGTATTALALVSSGDGNNNTPVGTVAGAPYNTIVLTEGYQLLDFNNGNGATPFALSIDFGSASSLQTWERSKYIPRRGTAETLFGRNASLFTGIIRNWAYDGELGGPWTQSEILAWGTEVAYTGQTVNFTLGEVVTFSGGGRGRLIQIEDAGATGNLIFALEPGIVPLATETMTGLDSGGNGTVSTITNNANFGTALLCAIDDQGTTGNFYVQLLTGIAPLNNQLVRGGTSFATSLVNGTVASRVINNQFAGVYTGANFQTNFGIAIDPTDAVVGDIFPNLLGVNQLPPNNQLGVVGALVAGDYVNVYAWDGVAVDVNGDPAPNVTEQALAIALTAGVSTVVNVGAGNIPLNTPQVGNIRIERDSDGNYDKVPYASHDGDDEYTLVGTAPSAAAIANNVYRSPIDLVTTGTQESYTAVYGGTPDDWGITVRRGSNGPIKTFKGSAEFGATGFNVNAQRITDE